MTCTIRFNRVAKDDYLRELIPKMAAGYVLVHGTDRLGSAIRQRLVKSGCEVVKLHSDHHSVKSDADALQFASLLVLAPMTMLAM